MGRVRGFTLIELMIVVMIIAVLTAIALPQFQRYVARTQAAEVLLAMDAVKQRVIEEFYSGIPLIDMNSGAGMLPPGTDFSSQYVSLIEVVAGDVRAQFGNDANILLQGHWLIFKPDTSNGTIVWRCVYSDVGGFENIPTMCRNAP